MCCRAKRGTGSLVAAGCGSSRFPNGSRRGKDARRVVAGNFLLGVEPMLDVAPAEFGSVEIERFATDERHGFRFHFAQMAGGAFIVHELFGGRVSENDVGDFVEGGFVRKPSEWIYGNLTLPRKALDVAVDFVKVYSADIEYA